MERRGSIPLVPAWLTPESAYDAFPNVEFALLDPNGLLAMGGDLHPERLLYAYRHGIFPWYSEEHPILWWSPNPRYVIYPSSLNVSRSLRKVIRRKKFTVTVNRDFDGVISGCAAPRGDNQGTWITGAMREAYHTLHEMGHAVSIECWAENRLAGGLYGIQMGRVFFGESMFSALRDASKVALEFLCRRDYALIDCQLPNDHLISLGAVALNRREFVAEVKRYSTIGPGA